MGAVGGGEEVASQWILQRSISARGQGSNGTDSPRHTASPPPQTWRDAGFQQPGSKGEGGPLVAWSEEGTELPSLLQQLLLPGKSAGASPAPTQGSLECVVESASASPAAPGTVPSSRAHSDSHRTAAATVLAAATAAAAAGAAGGNSPSAGTTSQTPGGSTSTSSIWRAQASGARGEPGSSPEWLPPFSERRRRAPSQPLEWPRSEAARASFRRSQSPSPTSPVYASGNPAPTTLGTHSGRLAASSPSPSKRAWLLGGGLAASPPGSPLPNGAVRIGAVGVDALLPTLQLSSSALSRPTELSQPAGAGIAAPIGSPHGGTGGSAAAVTVNCRPGGASPWPEATTAAAAAAAAVTATASTLRDESGAAGKTEEDEGGARAAGSVSAYSCPALGSGGPGPGPPAGLRIGAAGGLKGQRGDYWDVGPLSSPARSDAASGSGLGSGPSSPGVPAGHPAGQAPGERQRGGEEGSGEAAAAAMAAVVAAAGGLGLGQKLREGCQPRPEAQDSNNDNDNDDDEQEQQQQQQEQQEQQQKQRQQQFGRRAFLSAGREKGPGPDHSNAHGARGGASGTALGGEARVAEPRPARCPSELTRVVKVAPAPAPAPVRHPPAIRVAIGLLPSPGHSPPGPSAGSSRGLASAGTASSPASAVSQLLLSSSRSKRAAAAPPYPEPTPPPASASAAANAHGPLRPPSPSQPPPASAQPQPQPQPPPWAVQSPPSVQLPGLPSFLGSPVVLDPPPPHVLPGGPGAPGPALGLSLSRSTSGADRTLSASASLSALHAVPPAPSQPAGQPPEGGPLSSCPSARNRAANSSRRSITGRNSFHRCGSYFRVREALPEAVLDNLPSVQAARGLPPPPQHPGAVPDEWPPPSVTRGLMSVSSGVATAASGGSSGGSNSVLRRQGMDLAISSLTSSAAPGFGPRLSHAVSNGSSSPQSTLSGAAAGGANGSGGGADGASPSAAHMPTHAHGGPLLSHASWLRRAEAMPPVDMLPIQPSPPPLAMDHLQPPSALSALTPRLARGASRGGGAGGLCGSDPAPRTGGTWSGAGAGAYSPGTAGKAGTGGAGAGGGFSAEPSWAQLPSDGPSTEQLPDLTPSAAAAMAAAAVASSSLVSEEGLVSESQLASPACRGPGGRDVSHERTPPPPAPAPPRHTFRTQSKLRLMNLGALGLGAGGGGGGDNGVAAAAAAIDEQEALLALLGSSRMLSSVLNVTSNPVPVSRPIPAASDPAVHGVRDPRYDPTAHIAVIPEHTVPLEAAAAAAAAPVLLGNSRMGSTAFSPPSPTLSRLASSLRRPQRSRSGATWSWRDATRAAMLDLQLLSRRVGATSVVGPNGRTIHLVAKQVSTSEAQLEVPPPEELVSAVNGHALPSGFHVGGGGGLATVVGSSDESEEPPLRDAVRVSRTLKGPAALGAADLSGSRASSSGAGRPSSSSVVPSLVRHLSAPARRLTLTSNSGLGPAAPLPPVAGIWPPPPPHPAAVGRALPHKPSFITASLRFLKRAFTMANTPAAYGGERSWQPHNAGGGSGGGGDDGRRIPLGGPQRTRPAPDPQQHGRGRVVFLGGAAADAYAWASTRPDSGASTIAAGSSGGGCGGGGGGNASRHRLLASQRSFLKHSAVLGWVQPGGPEDDAGAVRTSSGTVAAGTGTAAADSDGDGESSGSPVASASRAVTSSGAARLHSLQSLIATGGGQLTCDAVVAFTAGDGGAGDGGDCATAARRRRAARGHYSRRGLLGGGGGGPWGSDDTSEDARGSAYSGLTTTGDGTGAGTGGGGGGWLAPSAPASADAGTPARHSPVTTVTAVAIGAAGDGADVAAAGRPPSPRQYHQQHQHQQLSSPQALLQPPRGPGPLGSPTSPGAASLSPGVESPGRYPHPHTHTLLGRIGSKLSRSMKRGSLVFPLQAGDADRDPETSGTLSQDLEPSLA